MANPNIWAPGTSISAANSLQSQAFVATEGQRLFTITNFTYAVGAGALYVFVSGGIQRLGVDYTETSISSFTLDAGVPAGTVVYVVAFTAISVEIPVVDVDQVHTATAKGVLADLDEFPLSDSENGWTLKKVNFGDFLSSFSTAAGLALLDDATASDQLTTLGVSTYMKGLLDDADEATLKASINLEPGVDVLAYVAPSTSGNVLTSNGSAWTSTAPAGGGGVTTFNTRSGAVTLQASDITGIDGHTSGIDADLLDGNEASAFVMLSGSSASTNFDFAYTGGSTIAGSYTKVLSRKVYVSGTVTARFSLQPGADGTAYARVYKNGSAVGTARSLVGGSSVTWYSEDFSVTAGDILQVYGYVTGSGSLSCTVSGIMLGSTLNGGVLGAASRGNNYVSGNSYAGLALE